MTGPLAPLPVRAGTGPPAPDLTGSVRVLDGVAHVVLAGELDRYSAPTVQALLRTALTSGASAVELDVALVSFCDAGGLGTLVGAQHEIARSGAQLSLTRVPALLRKLLVITGLTDALHAAPARDDDAVLAASLAAASRHSLTRRVLDESLHLVVVMSQAVMAGADGVSITVPRDGRLRTVAASDDVVLQMDHDQYDTGEGPCIDAATHGTLYSSKELYNEPRWPQFVPRARARGIESIMSTPLMSADRPLGALNVYSRAPNALASHEQRWAIDFAQQASAVLQASDNTASADSVNREIDRALRSRHTIALAQGITMTRERLEPEAAYRILTDISRRTSRPLLQVCHDLVKQAAPAAPDNGDAAGVGADVR